MSAGTQSFEGHLAAVDEDEQSKSTSEESCRLALSSEPTSLAEVMVECRAIIEPQGQKRGMVMTFPEFNAPLFVLADRIRLKQVLINLLSNAIKYGQANGTVVVEYTVRTPERVRVSGTDTGAGLAQDKLCNCFSPSTGSGKR